jgi:formylglycine-generating enzyme required for sulfatase activity
LSEASDRKHLRRLRRLLDERLGPGELQDICFDLGVEYSNLPGERKADKARELIAYLNRRNRIPELLEICRASRPDVDWPKTNVLHRLDRLIPAWAWALGMLILVALLAVPVVWITGWLGHKHPPADASLGDMWTRPADKMAMVYVPGTTSQMGSSGAEVEDALALCKQLYDGNEDICRRVLYEDESPQHLVTLEGLWIDRTEVTNAQYKLCVAGGICVESIYADNTTYGKDDYPVVGVAWDDAATYCNWVGGRLPSEAEWEYTARGPDQWRYPWGNQFDGTQSNHCGDTNCQQKWADDSVDDGHANTAPVGSYPGGASWCGVLDMAGNVSEWIGDWYGGYSSAARLNPMGPETGDYKVLRGGGWSNDQVGIRSANRMSPLPTEYWRGRQSTTDLASRYGCFKSTHRNIHGRKDANADECAYRYTDCGFDCRANAFRRSYPDSPYR